MARIAIVFHSGYGHTAVLARAVGDGAAAVAGQDAVTVVPVGEIEARWHELDHADAIVFGAPTYMGSASAPMKAFMDASSKRWMDQAWRDKLAAGFTNSGAITGDKDSTLMQFMTFAMQHGMVWVGLGELPGGPEAINRFGASTGAMAVSINAPPDETPPPHDIATAHALGRRVATAARRWAAGAA
jgi:NAD(P)H dehydrogenase (quinone)